MKVNLSKAHNMDSNNVQLQCLCLFQKTFPFWKDLIECKPQKKQGW